ncbi:hypothetical protein BKA65DRAFT_486543 [Rhexocercosporidium sp. MPI-PUGE-AT-0058]|nr:hypothetical protein BKA65DRAFT_486543 [Rhexocercosporidium sp. MPI-PUGE-AT-0058]
MVLVKHEIPVRARVPQNQGSSNASSSTESSSGQAPLPQAAYESTFQVEPRPSVAPISPQSPASRQSYQMQLMLLEQQNKKRLLWARQEAEETRQWLERNSRTVSEELKAASREDYHLQQMALEHENGKRLMGARQQLAAHTSGSRNQGHDAHASVGSYEQMDPMTQMSQLSLLEQQNKRRLEQVRRSDVQRQRFGCGVSEGADRDEGNRQVEDSAKQNEAPNFLSQNPPAETEDKWGKGSFPAGQGVISGYEVQLMALENRRKEEAATRSQTEVEFSQQRRRYLAEEAEMSRLSGQQLPGAPGSSCAPPGTVHGHPLAFRPVPRPDAQFDDLYDN